ncbi:MAG: hypothetical protein IH934_06185 [Nanoarchaeota archaeon]|nr:hypothetical protein [Nanoarchaeota archaeon]
MNKKSQGLSINVIIIVAIALIVLVVLIAIFTGRLGGFSKGVDTAQSCSSTCTATGLTKESAKNVIACAGIGKYFPGKYGDVADGEVCCCKSRGSTGSGGGSADTGSGTEDSGTGTVAGGEGQIKVCGVSGLPCCKTGKRCEGSLTCGDELTAEQVERGEAPGLPYCK